MNLRPASNEYAPYFGRYIELVPETNILDLLERQSGELTRLGSALSEEQERFRYLPDKWSVREVIGHLTDAERVFGYRAFCISRGEQAALPRFNENTYVAESSYDRIVLGELIAEFAGVRSGNLAFLRRLDEAKWSRMGIASDKPVSVRALAFIMAGHVIHHAAILRERYGVRP